MHFSYFKIAWRHLLRDRQFSVLNLMGLSTGLACTFLIYLWVSDELSIDKFNKKDSRLYQVLKTSPGSDGSIATYETTPAALAQAMMNDMPDVEYATSVFVTRELGILSYGDKHIKAKPQFTDTNYFNVFSYPLLQGNQNNPLSEKHEILLSDRMALKLFNTTQNIVGKTVVWNRGDELDGPYKVAGIFTAPPENATVQFDILFSYLLYFNTYKDQWGLNLWYSNSTITYAVMKKNIDIEQFNEKIRKYSQAKYKALHGTDGLEWEGRIFLQRYSDRYLYGRFENDGVQAGGRIEYVKLFSVIAVFILVIACINFMNLSTAKASRRMKEVGIKKVVGAGRITLILQYMAESMMMAFLSLGIALLIVFLLLPVFNGLTGKNMNLPFDTDIILSALCITLITGFIAGSYPAFYLSGFKPMAVLKGKLNVPAGESWTRKGLVVFQFTVSVVLIVSVLVIYNQVKYIHSVNLGYNKDNIIRFKNEGELRNNLPAFLAQVRNIPGVVNASAMGGDLMGNHGGGGGISWPGKLPGKGVEFGGIDIDYDMMETFGLKMAEGRMFSRQFGNDSNSVIFNEAAIAAMHLKNPVGQIVNMWGKNFQIIGVVKDFHYESLYAKIGPFFFRFSQDNDNIIVKVRAGKESETLARLEKFYKQYNMGLPFEYTFIDEDYHTLYAPEERVAILSRYFAGIAILISCLGLFGLAAFTAQKRQKEIGIRKVVGATVTNVVFMLSKDFLKLVLTAVLIAFPVSWWVMNQWLQSFAYRVHIGAAIFLITGASIVLITLLTISFQSIKAAMANPVKSLRTE